MEILILAFIYLSFVAIVVLLVKYIIRYGINYYFRKLTEHEMQNQISDIEFDLLHPQEFL